MISSTRFPLFAIALWAAVTMAFRAPVFGEEPKEGRTDEKAAQALLEQDIYIPYAKLREVFEKHGRGVFLPYDKFQELWQAAQDKTRPAAEAKPPVGALLSEVDNEATVEKDVVRVKAKVKIEVLAEGWNSISLRLSDAAITSATIAGKPARIVGDPGQDYRLLIDKKGKEPERIELSLEYAKAITRVPGQNSVSFQSPQSPVSRWRVVIPQAGVKVNLHPLIAATEVPAESKNPKGEEGQKAEETVVLAFVGVAPVVQIDWTPKAEGATGLAAMASVKAEQQLWIGEGVTRSRTTLDYSISRAELGQLTIEAPADQKVVNVFDANVRQWSVEPAEGRQRIAVQLFEPAKTSQQVTVELEKYTGEKQPTTITAPLVRAAGVGRQQGVVVVRIAEGLRAEAVETSGLLQVDAGELPPALRGAAWAFAYRYATPTFDLALKVEKVEPRITADSLVEASLQPERLTLDVTTIYTIEKAGVFSLTLAWPEPDGCAVRQVRGVELAGATPVQVDSYHCEGGKETRLVVNLSRKAIGRVAIQVQLQKELRHSELLAPSDKPATIAIGVPAVHPATAERATGRLMVYAPESLRVDPADANSLRSISFQEALEGVPSCIEKPADLRPVLAYAYTEHPVRLTLAAERRKPQVTVEQLLRAEIQEGVVKYNARLSYHVLYSGVKWLRLDVPAEVATVLHVAPSMQEQRIEPPPADLAKGDVALRLSGRSELLGDGQVDLNWEKKIDKLDVGKSIDVPLPHLRPRDVFRASGQIVLMKAETVYLKELEEPKRLQAIDPQTDLKPPEPSAAKAYEFHHDDWSLSILATRYQLEDVQRTSIERALVRMVVTPAKVISVQALYRMRSVRQRLKVQLPADAEFSAQSLRVNGKPQSLEKGGGGEHFVPLSGTSGDKPFLVEIRYTLSGDGRRLDLPAFPEDAAVVKTYLLAYLPETQTLLGARGPWTEEFCWRQFAPHERVSGFDRFFWWCDPTSRWQPTSLVDVSGLGRWVREGVGVPGGAADDIPTDGRLYVYSTLRPEAPPYGSLRMEIRDARGLSGIVFGGAVLLGVLLLPARLPRRTFVVGTALIALVLAGVFVPTFSMQILNGMLVAAVFIVAVLWIIAMTVRRGRGKPATVPAVAGGEHGVDLSQYQPEPPVVEPPAAAPGLPKPDGHEGGQNHG